MAAVARSAESRALGLSFCAFGFACALSLGACHAKTGSEVYVIAGPEADDHREFRPLASYAEYLVLPGARRELKITLASYAASCDAFVEPGENDTSVTVTVIAPLASELAAGSYVWAGHEAHGGTEQAPERAYALPMVRLGHRGLVLPPGGEIQLDAVATTQDGRVRGLFNFDFAGDADHAAASLKGGFEAKLCRVRL